MSLIILSENEIDITKLLYLMGLMWFTFTVSTGQVDLLYLVKAGDRVSISESWIMWVMRQAIVDHGMLDRPIIMWQSSV